MHSDILELSDNIIISSCNDILIGDVRISLRHDAGQDHSTAASEVGCRDIFAFELRRTDDDRLMRVEDLYLGSQILQLGQIIEPSFIERLKDLGHTARLSEQCREYRLQIRRESWIDPGLKFHCLVLILVLGAYSDGLLIQNLEIYSDLIRNIIDSGKIIHIASFDDEF